MQEEDCCVSICTSVLVKQVNWRRCDADGGLLRQYLYFCTSKASKLEKVRCRRRIAASVFVLL